MPRVGGSAAFRVKDFTAWPVITGSNANEAAKYGHISSIVGSHISTLLDTWSKDAAGVTNYQKLFEVPMWAALACLVLLFFFYPSKSKSAEAA